MADNDESISTLEMIDFGSLLGAPLTACVEAQAQAAAATTRYMQQVGFRMNNDSALEAKTMTFTYTIGGKGKRLTVPLISVVPLPYLQIDNVNLRFSTDVAIDDGYLVGAVSSEPYGTVTSSQSSMFKSDMRIDVDIKATTSDLPYGIGRILEVLGNSIEVTQKNKE